MQVYVEDAVLLVETLTYTVLVPNYPPSFYDPISNFSFTYNSTLNLRILGSGFSVTSVVRGR